jgi:MYXO-CTERM domain-containing protein
LAKWQYGGEVQMMKARVLSRWLVPGAVRPVVLLAALAAGVAVHADPADACTIGIGLIWQSYPASEATGVPTNVVPILYTDGSQDDVLLQRADGTPVAVEVKQEDPDGYILRPLRELEPLTDYELMYGPARVQFQTGEGPAPVTAELDTPDFRATRVSYPIGGTCGRSEFVCGATASAGLLFEVRLGDDVMLSDRVLDPSQVFEMAPVFLSFRSPDDCLDVYARDVRGGRSAPLTLCGDELAVVEIGAPPPSPIDCDEAVAIAEGEVPNYPRPGPSVVVNAIDSGCGFSPAPRQHAAGWVFVSALGLLLAHRKRRSTRR